MVPSIIRLPVLCVVLCLMFYFTLKVETTHQRWWLYGCQCANWQSRNSVREVVMNSYKGLFVSADDLTRLPVVKINPQDHAEILQSYVANTLPNINGLVNPGCCSTEWNYEIFNETRVQNQEIKVVHFDKAFQFVPTGRCKANSTCRRGTCLQMYRHHWMLVWDENLSSWPPVTFLPVEIPSHCQCVNVGTPGRNRRNRGNRRNRN